MTKVGVFSALQISPQCAGTFSGEWRESNTVLQVTSPVDGEALGTVSVSDDTAYEEVVRAASENFARYRSYPAPKRGEIIRALGNEFRRCREPLAQLISLEMGKLLIEARGEVQEAIDICDYAVGLSRQLYGKTMPSERPEHRMFEQWHPLGNVGVITAFNFPLAVWSWNAIVGAVCGNSIVWKPSELTPLTAVATIELCQRVTREFGFPSLFTLLTGPGPDIGQKLAGDRRFPLISATGSCDMGREVGATVARRLGRSLLELGGNNAIIVAPDANLELTLQAIVFGALGTSGQRCTSTRRVLVDREIQEKLTAGLIHIYRHVPIGNPLEPGILMGPLVSERSVEKFREVVDRVSREGGKVLYGGHTVEREPSRLYVEPTLVLAHRDMPLLREETFAPILYILPVSSTEEAIAIQNDVPQGLSSAIFTENFRAAERFLSPAGSDCGIANVNIGTSGAEIGGAFGGEKDTGGGREAGSDSWQHYMRRQTSTVNWGGELPLAQGISFS